MKAKPNDRDAKLKYNECNKIVKKIAFEKAISVEDTKKNIADTINLDAMSKYICNSFGKFQKINFEIKLLLVIKVSKLKLQYVTVSDNFVHSHYYI